MIKNKTSNGAHLRADVHAVSSAFAGCAPLFTEGDRPLVGIRSGDADTGGDRYRRRFAGRLAGALCGVQVHVGACETGGIGEASAVFATSDPGGSVPAVIVSQGKKRALALFPPHRRRLPQCGQ